MHRELKRRPRVNDRDFVIAWQTGSTLEEVASKLSLPRCSVQARANWFRREGVNLKRFPRTRAAYARGLKHF